MFQYSGEIRALPAHHTRGTPRGVRAVDAGARAQPRGGRGGHPPAAAQPRRGHRRAQGRRQDRPAAGGAAAR